MDYEVARFLRDTSIFLHQGETYVPTDEVGELHESLLKISESLKVVSSQILELDDNPIVMVDPVDPMFHMKLGTFGEYVIPTTPENLATVAARLQKVAYSTRFIKAILGHWPA